MEIVVPPIEVSLGITEIRVANYPRKEKIYFVGGFRCSYEIFKNWFILFFYLRTI